MRYRQIAQKIPAEYRREILELKILEEAKPSPDNKSMMYLATIWKDYVDPYAPVDCPLCLANLLKNFRELHPSFVDLEKEHKLLDGL